MTLLQAGDQAPDFSLPDQDGGNLVTLSEIARTDGGRLLLPQGRHARNQMTGWQKCDPDTGS